ncbi:MAG: hypothetical protein JSV88_11700 [Candidatus Aminicenantes bacterium]|nr:MAG: hypothetical protein JSV88_11700 [Candidatus Aminicenantes bacterium]
MLEYWNDRMAPFGQINACGGNQNGIYRENKTIIGKVTGRTGKSTTINVYLTGENNDLTG